MNRVRLQAFSVLYRLSRWSKEKHIHLKNSFVRSYTPCWPLSEMLIVCSKTWMMALSTKSGLRKYAQIMKERHKKGLRAVQLNRQSPNIARGKNRHKHGQQNIVCSKRGHLSSPLELYGGIKPEQTTHTIILYLHRKHIYPHASWKCRLNMSIRLNVPFN